jgi:hypothetical protein
MLCRFVVAGQESELRKLKAELHPAASCESEIESIIKIKTEDASGNIGDASTPQEPQTTRIHEPLHKKMKKKNKKKINPQTGEPQNADRFGRKCKKCYHHKDSVENTQPE